MGGDNGRLPFCLRREQHQITVRGRWPDCGRYHPRV